MIDSKHHFSLNGILYRAAESSQGDHYVLGGEPLRPPNAVMVQGEDRQDKFQTRPDLLLWNITDWAGGEGQIVYDSSNQNRHYELHKVDPFVRPGTLTPGYYVANTDDGTNPMSVGQPRLVPFNDGNVAKLALFSKTTAGAWWLWNSSTESWDAQTAYTGMSAGPQEVVAYNGNFYLVGQVGTTLYSLPFAGGAVTSVATGLNQGNSKTTMELIDPYLYHISWAVGEVEEIDPSSGTVTSLDVWDTSYQGVLLPSRMLSTAGANRLYVAVPYANGDTVIREIVPTSAAGPGYGREIARFPSQWVTSMWLHQGTLFLGTAPSVSDRTERGILYVIPDGQYGSLGYVRKHLTTHAEVRGSSGTNTVLSSHFLLNETAQNIGHVYELDTVSGGIAEVAEVSGSIPDGSMLVGFDRDIFFIGTADGSGSAIYRMETDKYASDGYAVTPWHDMGLADEKILSSLVLSTEELPADWKVGLYYAVDGSTSFTLAGEYSTTGGTGTKFTVSTDLSSVQFRRLQVKISFTYTGVGTPTTKPVVQGVDVLCQVNQIVPVWQLLLDLSDDHSGGSQSLVGSEKVTNIKTAGDLSSVVAFQDGYQDRRAGHYTEYDVVIDSYKIILDRPGEGFALVSLREVV